jgi:hypothetical protein
VATILCSKIATETFMPIRLSLARAEPPSPNPPPSKSSRRSKRSSSRLPPRSKNSRASAASTRRAGGTRKRTLIRGKISVQNATAEGRAIFRGVNGEAWPPRNSLVPDYFIATLRHPPSGTLPHLMPKPSPALGHFAAGSWKCTGIGGARSRVSWDERITDFGAAPELGTDLKRAPRRTGSPHPRSVECERDLPHPPRRHTFRAAPRRFLSAALPQPPHQEQ